MRYTMTFPESAFDRLRAHLCRSENEEAAYLLARVVETEEEVRLLVRDVVPVSAEDIESQSPVHMVIRGASYVHAIKRSRLQDSAFVFVHSHPEGFVQFSPQDDREEPDLFALAHARNARLAHASVVASNKATQLVGRAWLRDGTNVPLDVIRVIGARWRFLFAGGDGDTVPEYFERQVRAFGSDVQRLLQRLHVGVVGAGGTGSAVAEQLIRLGIGRLTVIDDDSFDSSNVNRVYGSASFDGGLPKVAIAERHAAHIGVGTRVVPIRKNLSFKSAASRLRECDLVFGCTDDEWGRSILSRLSIYYVIPILDLGVIVDPEGDVIRAVHGRVTLLQPGYACLYCRGRISADTVTAESMRATQPERAAALAAEGYIPGVAAPAPSVISFTSAVASHAVTEFLDRVTGFKISDTKPSEFLLRFEADAFSRNTRGSRPECFCANGDVWGAGDRKPFLGLTWRNEK